MAKIQAIRGMNDILPDNTADWQFLEQCFQRVATRYGYHEIRFPILEQTQLFKRSIGEVTDIVEKEMYSFDDRNGDNLSLRPEGTAGCVRAADQHGLLYNQQQRLWYQGPMFRHERPQKGRYRQFDQFGLEAFGMAGPDIDAEVIQLSARLWKELGIAESLTLEINNIGSSDDRKRFGQELVGFLRGKKEMLDTDSQRRLDSNPLRILDSKSQDTAIVLKGAPVLGDFVNSASQEHFRRLKSLLRACGIKFIENPSLVRGLDYYNNAVFEWTTEELGAQGTVCAGGRYDGLVEQLGGRSTPAVGFAIGKERLVLLLQAMKAIPESARLSTDIYLAIIGDDLQQQGMELAETLRDRIPSVTIQLNCGGGKYNSQLKKAYNSGARFVVILEQSQSGDRIKLTDVKLRRLDESSETTTVVITDLAETLERLITN